MKTLREFLEVAAGAADIDFIIPHPFLPPRYQKQSLCRNLILGMDREFRAMIRWEGELVGRDTYLSPAECSRLIHDVLERMKKYRQELRSLKSFLGKVLCEEPEGNSEEDVAEPKAAEELPEDSYHTDFVQVTADGMIVGGGESPYPLDWEEER